MGNQVTAAQVMALVEELAPPALAESWDRVGFQVGDPNQPVERVLVSLGVSRDVLEEAVARECHMIIAHHPLILRPLTALTVHQGTGALIAQALAARIAIGVAHTNLDRAPGGLNDWLAERLGLVDAVPLASAAPGADGDSVSEMARIGRMERPVPLGQWVKKVAQRLGVEALRYVGDPDRPVQTVACMGGSGASAVPWAAAAGADVLVTGDMKFHDALDALDLGLAVVDPGHFASEVFMAEKLAAWMGDEARRRGWRLEALPARGEADPFRFYALGQDER